MRQIQFYYDEPVTVTESTYLAVVDGVVEALDTEARLLFFDQKMGIPNLSSVATPDMIENHQSLVRGIVEIDDVILREMALAYQKQIDLLWQLEHQLIQTVSEALHLAIPQTKNERKKWHQKMNSYFPVAKPWKEQESYQQLVSQSLEIFASVQELKLQIKQRLEHLQSQLGSEQMEEQVSIPAEPASKTPREALIRPANWQPSADSLFIPDELMEPFDQEIDDLIDEVEEEPDAREAIKILRRVLNRLQDNGQKSTIYMLLGLRHEELGNTGWAIRSYTDSLKTIKQPLVLFWRGRLYYQQRKFTEAKADLSAALTAGLPSPEREEAEQYIQAINL